MKLASAALTALLACTAAPAPAPAPTPSVSPTITRAPDPPRAAVDAARMMETVRTLAALGPREATSAAYRAAVQHVASTFRALGYDVRRPALRVPAGVSWGIEVPEGRTVNVVAEPPGFDPAAPHLLVGAHLDTVPQAPGANDNASGVAIVLELARLARIAPPRLPVVFVAFAAEEPRGPGDELHHFGSREYVADLPGNSGLLAMISLDRVGIGRRVRVCTGGRGSDALATILLARARRASIPSEGCINRASDHWSFEKAGFPAARLLGAEHPSYHTARDLPRVVDGAQLRRIARLAWQTLRTLRQSFS